MTEGIFGERGTRALEHGLWALALRQRVISDNVANANTPGFKRGDVSFARELESYLDAAAAWDGARGSAGSAAGGGGWGAGSAGSAAGGGGPAPAFRPTFYRQTGTAGRLDGNNVDMEREMASLLETALLYQATVRQLSGKLRILQLAVSEGRR